MSVLLHRASNYETSVSAISGQMHILYFYILKRFVFLCKKNMKTDINSPGKEINLLKDPTHISSGNFEI
jgi:hypothetical protein